MSTRKGRIRRFVITSMVIIIPLGSVCLWGYLSWSIGRDAQNTLNAYTLVLDVLAEYLKQNGGRWPKSWDDLVAIRHPGYWPFQWPDDLGGIRKRVRINFDVTTDDVIASGVEHFTAVTQREPNYGLYEWRVVPFLEAARLSVGHIQKPAGPKRNPL